MRLGLLVVGEGCVGIDEFAVLVDIHPLPTRDEQAGLQSGAEVDVTSDDVPEREASGMTAPQARICFTRHAAKKLVVDDGGLVVDVELLC